MADARKDYFEHVAASSTERRANGEYLPFIAAKVYDDNDI